MTTPHEFSDSDEDDEKEEEEVGFYEDSKEEMVNKSDHDDAVRNLVLKFDNAAIEHEKQMSELKVSHEANIKTMKDQHTAELTKSQLRINVLIDKFINDQ